MEKFDVIVVGGGFSGVAAALASARGGAKTLLIEKSNALGGSANVSQVNPFMKFSYTIDGEETVLCRGIFREITSSLEDMGAITGKRFFHDEYLKLILNRMVMNDNIELRFHSYLIDAECVDGKLRSVTVSNKQGRETFLGDYFIDATGDGDLAALAGCKFEIGREEDGLCQAMTLCFRVINVDIEKFFKDLDRIEDLYKKYKNQGKFRNPRHNVGVTKYITKNTLNFNTTRIIGKNPLNAKDLTYAEIEAREQIFEVFEFLKENADGMENAEIFNTAASIGVRESRRITGDYVLCGEDIMSCKKFDDAIAAGNYNIDIHNPSGGGTYHYVIPDGDYYTVPYRSLIPVFTQNLLTAGRCISATHEAIASVRIMPIVCCVGEAAGTAAALAKKDNTTLRNVDIAKLQKTLKENGAFF